jgi:hypothetical protein
MAFSLASEEDLELGRLRALAENAAAQIARERERRQAAENKIAAAAAMAAEAQVHCLLLLLMSCRLAALICLQTSIPRVVGSSHFGTPLRTCLAPLRCLSFTEPCSGGRAASRTRGAATAAAFPSCGGCRRGSDWRSAIAALQMNHRIIILI